MSKLATLAGIALVAFADTHARNSAHNNAMQAASAEDNKWDQRKNEGLKTIDVALLSDHSRSYVSDESKARTATRLKSEIAEHCRRRSEVLTQMTECSIANFLRTGL